MNLTDTSRRRLADQTLSHDEQVRLRCQIAADLEHRGQYEAACAALAELWRGLGQRPALEGLSTLTAAEVLLRVGSLSGWIGSVRQVDGAQDAAKDLLSESIACFQAIGENTGVAAARSELGYCYYRAGAYAEARVSYNEALKLLTDSGQQELQAKILLRLSIVDFSSGRYNDALRILTDSVELFEAGDNDALKGRFHNDLGCVLMSLGKAERRTDYMDRAIIEYTAAAHHFEQADHVSYRARAENNLGYLLYTIGRYEAAHEHLNRARRLFVTVRDKGSVAQVDETRARVLLKQGSVQAAERAIRATVRTLERGGEQPLLAEALTTQGRVLAKLGNFAESLNTLRRAADLAEAAGAVEDAGLALLTLLEEHGDRVTEYELLETYQRANSLLRETQDAETIARLRNHASRIVSARIAAVRPRRGRSRTNFWANFNLFEQVRAYEARYVQRALIDAQGSVTRAARLLGLTHYATLTAMLDEVQGRHKGLAHLRTPPGKRRRSILRMRGSRHTARFAQPKPAPPITILHVEDNRLVADTVREALELEGWRVETEPDGHAALAKLASRTHYDLLLLDNELPGLSGLDLLARARTHEQRQHIPIIMFSALDVRQQALRAGANACLRKPDDVHALTETIKQLLTQHPVPAPRPAATAATALPLVEIETARLWLRRFTPADLDNLARLLGDPEVMYYMGQDGKRTLSRGETETALSAFISDWQHYGFSRFAVLDKETGQPLGLCGWKQLAGTPELLYVFDKAHWGQGLATEAARACLRYGFEELGLERMVAVTRPEHEASRRVLEKLGLRYEHTARHYGVEAVQYAITRAEYRPDETPLYVLHRR